jgi:hypothetical protein
VLKRELTLSSSAFGICTGFRQQGDAARRSKTLQTTSAMAAAKSKQMVPEENLVIPANK